MLQFSSSISRQVWWVFEKELRRDVVFEVTQLAKQLMAPELKPAQVQVWPANSSKKLCYSRVDLQWYQLLRMDST